MSRQNQPLFLHLSLRQCHSSPAQILEAGLPTHPDPGPGTSPSTHPHPHPADPICLCPAPWQVELEEGHRLLLAQQQTRAQRACHLLTYLRVNILIGILVAGAISTIFWATKYSQDNKEVPGE